MSLLPHSVGQNKSQPAQVQKEENWVDSTLRGGGKGWGERGIAYVCRAERRRWPYSQIPHLVTGRLGENSRNKHGHGSAGSSSHWAVKRMWAERGRKYVWAESRCQGEVRSYKAVKQQHSKHEALLLWFLTCFLLRPGPGVTPEYSREAGSLERSPAG